MTGLVITIVVVLWILNAVSQVRRALARAQAQAADASAAAPRQAVPARAQRIVLTQAVARSLQQRAAQFGAAALAAQAMPALDASQGAAAAMPETPQLGDFTLPGGSAFGTLPGAGIAAVTATSAARFALAGASDAVTAIVAAAVIGPPVGLRPGGGFAADW